jgi:hypothetical protein
MGPIKVIMNNFKIMPSEWYKRRTKTELKQITEFKVTQFKKVDNSYCIVNIQYDSGDCAELTGRVLYNDRADRWTINGINPFGDYILLEVL